MDHLIHSILNWHKAARPNPTPRDAMVQLGCHYEEVSELYLKPTAINNEVFNRMQYTCSILADELKHYPDDYGIGSSPEQRQAVLDSLCDQIVTAIGVAHTLGFDIIPALDEVNRSNWSKFVDGKPVFDKYGKIVKPATYSPPNLRPMIWQHYPTHRGIDPEIT
jgi:predicted HAD superfamily Cof-like phosphohydrolase